LGNGHADATTAREAEVAARSHIRGVEEAQMQELATGFTELTAMPGLDEGDDGLLGWQERALCAQTDPEAFFPEKGGSTREAKKVCLSCDVRGDCLEYALSNDERFGIWGGLSERERRKLKKRAV
jgi:WhiB family redox-sensing transcriptional regulator